MPSHRGAGAAFLCRSLCQLTSVGTARQLGEQPGSLSYVGASVILQATNDCCGQFLHAEEIWCGIQTVCFETVVPERRFWWTGSRVCQTTVAGLVMQVPLQAMKNAERRAALSPLQVTAMRAELPATIIAAHRSRPSRVAGGFVFQFTPSCAAWWRQWEPAGRRRLSERRGEQSEYAALLRCLRLASVEGVGCRRDTWG